MIDVKRIAESLGFKPSKGGATDGGIYVSIEPGEYFLFDPLNNKADAFLVLEKLTTISSDQGLDVKLFDWNNEDGFSFTVEAPHSIGGKTLQEAICKAYINTLGDI